MFIVLIFNSENIILVLNFKSLTYFSILYYTITYKGFQCKVFLPGFFIPCYAAEIFVFYTTLKIMLININFRIEFSLIRQHRHAFSSENRLQTIRAMNVLSENKLCNINNKTYFPRRSQKSYDTSTFHTYIILIIVAFYDIISYSGYFEKKNK